MKSLEFESRQTKKTLIPTYPISTFPLCFGIGPINSRRNDCRINVNLIVSGFPNRKYFQINSADVNIFVSLRKVMNEIIDTAIEKKQACYCYYSFGNVFVLF